MKHYLLFRDHVAHHIFTRLSLSYLKTRFASVGISVIELSNILYR